MACGLPVITSATNGTAEIMTDGVDGLIIQDPADVAGLASRIRMLHDDPVLRQRLGEQASLTAQAYTWDRNGEQIRAIFTEVLTRKGHSAVRPLVESCGK
jgi:glycosyltransferase involved in cell wall biosynthesis